MAKSSSQKFIARSRAPRVQIEYELAMGGSVRKVQLPFVMGVLTDLAGNPKAPLPPILERKFLDFTVDNFDDRMKSMSPRVVAIVPNTLDGAGDLRIDLTFESIDDFSPAAVARKVPTLCHLLDVRQKLSNLIAYIDGKPDAAQLLASILKDPTLQTKLATPIAPHHLGSATPVSRPVSPVEQNASGATAHLTTEHDDFSFLLANQFRYKTESARTELESAVQTLAHEAQRSTSRLPAEVAPAIEAIIRNIDTKLSVQINHIIHDGTFQKLEGSWRGLYYLVSNTETDATLKIRVLSISKTELAADVAKTKRMADGVGWDQSPLFRKVYDQEYGQLGGEPYGCLIGDYYFDHSPDDVALLGQLASIAAAANSPFISGASSTLMGMNTWQDLTNPRDFGKMFDTPEYAAWRLLRSSEDAKYVGLTMPRILGRLPYGAATCSVEEFAFEEDTEGNAGTSYTWTNSAYAMGVNVNRSFKLYGWCTSIRGVESGGAVEGLPLHTFPREDGGVDTNCPTEVGISDRREAALAAIGLMPLVHRKNTDLAAFISAHSLHSPAVYADPETTANARVSARLPYLFACCRFVHFVKCLVRDRAGAFTERANLETYLENWINGYVLRSHSTAGQAERARRPLADASIEVNEISETPGYYTARFRLRPHYQLEGANISLNLVSKLPHA